MKILIAYDGSRSSEAALDDLERAGLPETGEALVVTVAEVWLPPPEVENGNGTSAEFINEIVKRHRERGERWLTSAEMMAKHADDRLRVLLPGWKTSAKATYGSPAWEMLTIADEFKPDLSVVGSQGQSTIGRIVLGSISQKILTEANCSVRVARGRIEVDPAPARLIVGFDGSAGANAAVKAVLDRNWPEGTELHLVAATDSIVPTAIGRFIPPVADWAENELRSEYEWVATMAEKTARAITKAGLKVTTRIVEGDPKRILAYEAENWHADCIFVGANAYGSRIERFLLGSTSAAVAARATCSVEVVRKSKG